MISPYPSGASTSTHSALSGSLRIRLHVERLDGGGVVRHAHGTVELLGEDRFVGAAEVCAVLERLPLLLQQRRGRVVGEPRKRCRDPLELRGVALQDLQLGPPLVEHARHDARNQSFGELDDVVEIRVRHLRLDHPELGQVAPRLRLLRAEGRAEAVDPAERHRVGLVIELAALREKRGVLLEVLHREERGRPLAGRRGEDRRVAQDEAAAIEEVTDRVDHLVAHAQDRGLTLRPNPQMPAIEQVV